MSVRVGGRPVAVRGVGTAAEQPRSVAFVVCHSRAHRPADVAETIGAFAALADALTREGDRAALVTCGDHARIVSGWTSPASVRRQLDGLSAVGDVVDEAEALRLAAALPPDGSRRIAVVRTDGRHLDASTETELARVGLPVFPLALPGTADVLPLVNLARATGGAYLDRTPGDALGALPRRLDAAWLVDLAVPDSLSGALSVRVGDVSTRLPQPLPLASAAGATPTDSAAASAPADAPSSRDSLPWGWIVLAALAIVGVAGWLLFGKRTSKATSAPLEAPSPPPVPMRVAVDPPVVPDGVAPFHADAPSIWLRGPGIDARLTLDQPRLIGRDAACDLVLVDPAVSARHARIDVEHGQPVVRDLGSTNGLVLDGQAVAAAPLVAGSRLVIGETELVVADVAWPQTR